MLNSGSVDFAFSFDSLVHAEADVIQAYVEQLASILRPGGAAFIHHSNLGQYARRLAVINKVPRKWSPAAARCKSAVDKYARLAGTVYDCRQIPGDLRERGSALF
jgi:hypothetical protein